MPDILDAHPPPWPLSVPGWLGGRVLLPDPNHARQPRRPTGIVIHSGESADHVAEAALQMGISYHFAWSHERRKLVQLVSLRRRAYHAGREGNDWLGIALSGPFSQGVRRAEEKADFVLLLQQLRVAWGEPALQWWCRHSDITATKRDPGPGFDETWLEGSGLEWRAGPGG